MRQVLKTLCVGGGLLGILALASQFSSQAIAQTPPPGIPLALVQQLNALQQSVDALQQTVNAQQPRKFYLTVGQFDGAQAPLACATGFHMASLWEIFHTTNLRYDTTLGFTAADSGSGPPSDEYGWIRTGKAAATHDENGVANCDAYTSNSAQHWGSAASPEEDWETSGRAISPWQDLTTTCNLTWQVWCVQD